VIAAVLFCVGLGYLAASGIADEDGLNGLIVTLPFLAALAGGVAGARRWARRRDSSTG
jgi:hypothetical protein